MKKLLLIILLTCSFSITKATEYLPIEIVYSLDSTGSQLIKLVDDKYYIIENHKVVNVIEVTEHYETLIFILGFFIGVVVAVLLSSFIFKDY